MRVGFLCNGQGAQYPGMGRDIFEHYPIARQTYTQVSDVTGIDIAALCFHASAETIRDSHNAQLCLLALEISICRILRAHNLHPDVLAGFSFGLYPALIAADALSLEDGIRLVQCRGTLMRDAAARHNGAMALIEGMTYRATQRFIAPHHQVFIATRNTARQFFLAGEWAEIEKIVTRARAAGHTALVLPVGGAFHCPYVADAARRFQAELSTTRFQPPAVPVIGNVHAKVMTTTADIIADTRDQMLAPVAWYDGMRRMLDLGVTDFIEIGPGHGLGAMLRKIRRGVAIWRTNSVEELARVLMLPTSPPSNAPNQQTDQRIANRSKRGPDRLTARGRAIPH